MRAYVSTQTHTHTHTHKHTHTHTNTHSKRDLESLSEVVVCVQMRKRGPLRDDRVKAPKLLTEKKKGEKGKKSLETEERLLTTPLASLLKKKDPDLCHLKKIWGSEEALGDDDDGVRPFLHDKVPSMGWW